MLLRHKKAHILYLFRSITILFGILNSHISIYLLIYKSIKKKPPLPTRTKQLLPNQTYNQTFH